MKIKIDLIFYLLLSYFYCNGLLIVSNKRLNCLTNFIIVLKWILLILIIEILIHQGLAHLLIRLLVMIKLKKCKHAY